MLGLARSRAWRIDGGRSSAGGMSDEQPRMTLLSSHSGRDFEGARLATQQRGERLEGIEPNDRREEPPPGTRESRMYDSTVHVAAE